MKRYVIPSVFLLGLALFAAPALRADVKTTERSLTKFGGAMGAMMSRMGGAAMKDGVVSTVALKGSRLLRLGDTTGQIIDLTEEKVYTLFPKQKQYSVQTFAEARKQMEDGRAKMAQRQDSAPKPKADDKKATTEPKKEYEYDVSAKETGQHKAIAGYDTKEIILTIAAHEKGKKIEESGGFILTNDMWMAPKIAAIDEMNQVELKYIQAISGGVLGTADPQAAAMMDQMMPGMSGVAAKMEPEMRKITGTSLSSTTTFDTVKSPEEMKAPADDSSQGGGLAAMMARMGGGGNKGADANNPRSTFLTTTREYLTIQTSASAEDVAIPAGFKLKK